MSGDRVFRGLVSPYDGLKTVDTEGEVSPSDEQAIVRPVIVVVVHVDRPRVVIARVGIARVGIDTRHRYPIVTGPISSHGVGAGMPVTMVVPVPVTMVVAVVVVAVVVMVMSVVPVISFGFSTGPGEQGG